MVIVGLIFPIVAERRHLQIGHQLCGGLHGDRIAVGVLCLHQHLGGNDGLAYLAAVNHVGMFLGKAEWQVVQHDAFAHIMASQIAELVSLGPLGAVDVGVVHGDGGIYCQHVLHLKLEQREGGLGQIGAGVLLASRRRSPHIEGARGAEPALRRGRDGDLAGGFAQVHHVIDGFPGKRFAVKMCRSPFLVRDAVSNVVGIGGVGRIAGNGQGHFYHVNVIPPPIAILIRFIAPTDESPITVRTQCDDTAFGGQALEG